MKRSSEDPHNDALDKELQLKKEAVTSQVAAVVQLVRKLWTEVAPRQFAAQEPNELSEDMLSCDKFDKMLNAGDWSNVEYQSEFIMEAVKLKGRISKRIRMLPFRQGQLKAEEMKQWMQMILECIRGIFENMLESGDLTDEKAMTASHCSKRRKY